MPGPRRRPRELPRWTRIVRCRKGHARANRIPFHVRQRPPAVRRIHGDRVITSLPKMAGGSSADIQEAGIVGFKPAHHFGGCALMSRHRNQVEVIRHQTVPPQR